jgi:hypothetical protein
MSTVIWSFGAGTDSTGGICGMVERGEPIHHITFSDPGGEVPRTYDHIERFSQWLQDRGYPAVEMLRRKPSIVVGMGEANTLEAECLLRGQLPGIAYGFKSCSDKWKMQPFRAWLKEKAFTDAVVCIGYEAGETRRVEAALRHTEPYARRFPLVEWGWERADCIAAIERAGLPLPGKSACFFCPSSKKHEVIQLHKEYPELMTRALRIERVASISNNTMAGLGRRFAWEDVIRADEDQFKLLQDVPGESPCGCHDGGEEA